MPEFGKFSEAQLETVDTRLVKILRAIIPFFDFKVLEGHRNEQAQNAAFLRGVSQVRWPNGKHNTLPSCAVDLAPWPVDWTNSEAARQRFCYLAGWVMSEAKRQGVQLRWGGDWDGDRDTRDEKFRDLGHFEISEG